MQAHTQTTKRVTIYAMSEPQRPHLIRYIGKTTKPLHRRLAEHVAERNRTPSCHRRNWIKSLFSKNEVPKIWPIEICDQENWVSREMFWIKMFKPLGLVNGTDGGEGGLGNSGWKWKPEALKRISALRKGKKQSPENAERLRVQLLTLAVPLAHTKEAREKLRAKRLAKKATFGIQRSLFNSRIGTKRNPEHTKKAAESMRGKLRPHVKMKGSKPVMCIETGEIFSSIWRASQAKNVPCNKIRRSFTKGYSASGLHWRLI